MRRRAETVAIFSIGWFLVFFGVIAGLMPLVPGFVLIIVGFYVISFRSKWLKRFLAWMRGKSDRFNRILTLLELWQEEISSKLQHYKAMIKHFLVKAFEV